MKEKKKELEKLNCKKEKKESKERILWVVRMWGEWEVTKIFKLSIKQRRKKGSKNMSQNQQNSKKEQHIFKTTYTSNPMYFKKIIKKKKCHKMKKKEIKWRWKKEKRTCSKDFISTTTTWSRRSRVRWGWNRTRRTWIYLST